jgi:topoisomerase-4 subunit A
VLQPQRVADMATDYVAAISNEGRLLIFPISELPVLARGKGVKIMNIPKPRLTDRLEYMGHLLVLTPNDSLVVQSGKRHISLKFADLEHYRGERARRGLKLPRGFQKVDGVELLKGSP